MKLCSWAPRQRGWLKSRVSLPTCRSVRIRPDFKMPKGDPGFSAESRQQDGLACTWLPGCDVVILQGMGLLLWQIFNDSYSFAVAAEQSGGSEVTQSG